MATSTIKMTDRIKIVRHLSVSVTNGACSIPYPDGYSDSDHVLIQPVYLSQGLLGWNGMTQASPTYVNVYVRQGTTTPATGSKINFDAVFIKD